MKDVVIRWWTYSVIVLTAAASSAVGLEAQTLTRVLVRVVAHDAKIIGSAVGGAWVTVRDLETGDILAQGRQEGSTGNTGAIMGSREHGATVYDTEGAAAFLAELEISRPTRVEISAEGPLGAEHAIQTTTKSLLVVPGRDILGEGVILELNGFTVELQAPATDAVPVGEAFQARTRVTMLCGCPTEPGGMWDSSAYDIVARLVRDAEMVGEWKMAFSGTTSEYTADVTVDAPGEYELQVIAMDDGKGNFGMATRAITAR